MLHLDETTLVIPTYRRGPDSPFVPLTLAGVRGGRRPPYPYHMQDDIDLASMQRDDASEHRVVRLSNGLLEAIVLPDMNGRLYALRSCKSGRDIFYCNHVVKPALVGLRGAWISGGIEFNFPTVGHSVSTVSPVFCTSFRESDAVGVVVGDMDRCTRQRWQVTLRLRSGRAALDIETRLTNPGDVRERLYYWENAAVAATDDLRFVCRCDWTVGKTSQPFPIRDGVDRSFHANNPRPLDHFGYRSHADYFGAYYANRRTGTYHVAPRMALPGQKYFTWGTGEDQRIWKRYLTDDDGQYVEIQAGLLETQWVTDWLPPGKSVRAHGSWFGTEHMGEVRWASSRLAIATRVEGDSLVLELYSIDVSGHTVVVLSRDGDRQTQTAELEPDSVQTVAFTGTGPAVLQVSGPDGMTILTGRWYGPLHRQSNPDRDRRRPEQWAMNARANSPRGRAEVAIQYHRWMESRRLLATVPANERCEVISAQQVETALKSGSCRQAFDQAREALLRYPGDTRLHGLAAAAAWRCLRSEPNAADAADLRDHALAARRDAALRPAMVSLLSAADMFGGDLVPAEALLRGLVEEDGSRLDERIAWSACRRHLGDEASAAILEGAPRTLFHYMLELERWLGASQDDLPELPLPSLLPGRSWSISYRSELLLEAILGYWRLGLLTDVVCLVRGLYARHPRLMAHPLSHLLLMDAALARGAWQEASTHATDAAACPVDWIVPFRWETDVLLRHAATAGVEYSGALAFMKGIRHLETGDFDSGAQALEVAYTGSDRSRKALSAAALADWAESVKKDPATTGDWLRRALDHSPGSHRLLLRLDARLRDQQDTERRSRIWQRLDPALRQRGDITLSLARLAMDLGDAPRALDLLSAQTFSVYEADASVRRVYVDACLVSSMKAYLDNEPDRAETVCRRVLEFPLNLGAASYLGEHSRLARYLLGVFAHLGGRAQEARDWWRDVTSRSGASVAYAVGEQDAKRRGRIDEQVAVALAHAMSQATSGEETTPLAKPVLQGEETARTLAALIVDDPAKAVTQSDEALNACPCDNLLRILSCLARIQQAATSIEPDQEPRVCPTQPHFPDTTP